MCKTRVVAESTNCPCRLTWSQAVVELKQEAPLTSWILLGLWHVIVYALGIALGVVVGAAMLLAWCVKLAWRWYWYTAPAAPSDSWDMSSISRRVRVRHGR